MVDPLRVEHSDSIAVDNLSFAWSGSSLVLDQCQFRIPRGQLWMLLGPNGSGKSTLFRILSGLVPTPAGASVILDRPVGVVFQNPDHQLVMPTVGTDVAFSLASEPLSLLEIRWRVEQALTRVGLQAMSRRPIHSLSGGQKQRVAVAGALACQSQLLLLDEPTALLDPDSQQELLHQVRTLVDQEGLTALWITHRLNELDWADGALILWNGQVLDQGTPPIIRRRIEQLFMNHRNPNRA